MEYFSLNGERSSNSLYLERELGWRGVLVEPDPFFYTQLRGKSRSAYSINACISPRNYTLQVKTGLLLIAIVMKIFRAAGSYIILL